ncbi:hypothetical protein [Streptomyces sp. NPDC091879]|uniref:hypothetical protein n=1 Tax=Streptomyces sp. NPDC091879 TaxID=3366006 RepID=UPI003829EFC8
MPKKQRVPVRFWVYVLVSFALVVYEATIASSMLLRAGAISFLGAMAFVVGTMFGRQQERQKINPEGPQIGPVPDISD